MLERLASEFGVSNVALQWFSSYLTGRSQRVLVGFSLSDESDLRYGVPQGSVLGPLLFSLYTRQLARVIASFLVDYHFFADDSQLYSPLPQDSHAALMALQNIESCCKAVKKWMFQNKLKQNDSKTEVLICGPKHRRDLLPVSSLQVGDANIEFSESVRTLGVLLDADLTFECQVSAIVSSCNFNIRRISRARHCMSRDVAIAAAVAFILSRLDYCNSLLYGITKAQTKRLQVAQNSAARVVTKTRMRDHISPVLRQLHWLPVEQRIQHKLLSLVYQTVTKTAPQYLQEITTPYVPPRVLRSSSKMLLQVPGVREAQTKTYADRAFSVSAPILWKPVPLKIKQSESKASFKSQTKTLLFQEQTS